MLPRLLLFFSLSLVQAKDLTLQSVQIFFRHGQRYPSTYVVYPTEDPKMAEGKIHGEMTKFGIQQEYNLGQNLKETYGEFIGEKYNSSELLVMTGFDNRTSVSALAALAALLPPQQDQIFHNRLMWQPIPVHTEPILDMVSFGTFDHCPELRTRVRGMSSYKTMDDEYSKLVKFYEKNAGVAISEAFVFQKVLDSVKTRKDMPNELPLPEWADDSTFIKQSVETCEQLHVKFIDLVLESTGGWHYTLITENIHNRIHGNSQHKTILYAAHDANLMTMARFLGLSQLQTTLSPYGSYLAFEHHKIDGKDVVKVISHMNLNGSREELSIAGCPSPCLFSTFASLKRGLSSAQWTGVCQGYSSEALIICHDKVTMIAILLLISVLLFVAFVSALFACFYYRARVRQLTDPEQLHLLSS
ncbi:hypothetical protein L596_016360 [Steinernema carpocapsae]|uniref:Uncharacterized protein n=1 Tax=Steinernema carpocapsae TaxID=34508 RepID=A0A4U5NIQ1_STECR|nr:hypothetical protein L596_016360 [Steinernema carpocapsae]